MIRSPFKTAICALLAVGIAWPGLFASSGVCTSTLARPSGSKDAAGLNPPYLVAWTAGCETPARSVTDLISSADRADGDDLPWIKRATGAACGFAASRRGSRVTASDRAAHPARPGLKPTLLFLVAWRC